MRFRDKGQTKVWWVIRNRFCIFFLSFSSPTFSSATFFLFLCSKSVRCHELISTNYIFCMGVGLAKGMMPIPWRLCSLIPIARGRRWVIGQGLCISIQVLKCEGQ